MKRVAIVALTLLLVGTAAVSGQAQTIGQELGSLYLSASQTGYDPNMQGVATFTNFDFYVVVDIDYADIGLPTQNNGAGLQGWEGSVDVPSTITVLARAAFPPGAVNLGTGDNWLVGLGQQILAAQTPWVAVQYTGLLLADQTDLILRLAEASPSSFNPPFPGWNEGVILGECTLPSGGGTKCLRPFAEAKGMTINCSTKCMDQNGVGTETPSWGAVKANYGD